MSTTRATMGRVIRGSLNYGLGGFLPKVPSFLLVPVYTRFLSPEDYGIADVVTAVSGVFFIILRFGLPGAVIRFYFDRSEGEDLNRYVTTILAALTLWGVFASIVVSFAGGPLFSRMAPGISFYPFIVLGIWTAFFDVIPDLQRRLLQAQEASRAHMILTITRFGLGLVLTILLVVVLKMKVMGILLANFAAAVVYAAVAVVYLKRYLVFGVDVGMLRESLRYGAPIVPHHLFAWLMALANRLLLNGLAGTATAGLFGVASRFASPLDIAISSINAAWQPVFFAHRTAKSDSGGSHAIGESATALAVISIFLCLGVAVVGPDLVLLLTPEPYHPAAQLLPVLAVAGLATGAYYLAVTPVFFEKRTGILPVATASGAAVNVAGNLLLVPAIGGMGTAISQLLGNLVLLAVTVWLAWRLPGVPYQWRKLGLALVIAIACFSCAQVIGERGTFMGLGLKAVLVLACVGGVVRWGIRIPFQVPGFLGGRGGAPLANVGEPADPGLLPEQAPPPGVPADVGCVPRGRREG